MKQTILYAYLALMLAVGLPFLANLGTPDSPGGTNPTPSAAVDEASGPETQLPSAPGRKWARRMKRSSPTTIPARSWQENRGYETMCVSYPRFLLL